MKFKKEIVLIIAIIIGVAILEFFTNYISNNSVQSVSNDLDGIIEIIENSMELAEKNELSEEAEENMKNEIKEFKSRWLKKQDKLSMFIEHDELEKVTERLIALEENTRNGEYETALENSAQFRYWLQHFEEKEKLKFKNIF